ncbi:rhodanese-like domain-containing protein [Arenibacterium sp. CAU 1754]
MTILSRAAAVVCLAVSPGAGWADAVDAPQGYRQSDYDAPVPDALPGAIVVDDDAAYALWHSGRVRFVDVMPDLPRPKGLPEDAVWRGRARFSVPGALWLPQIGFGTLDGAAQIQFNVGLARASSGDKDAPLVFLCRADCWMSWNAAKRAIAAGYTRVFWYPAGTTGWTFWDWPTERLKAYGAP